jgi:5'-nucleotidase
MSQSNRLTLVLTNDDGVDAPGMSALVAATSALGACRVIAPSGPYSGCSHAVTTDGPLKVDERPDGRVAVEGSPADCVRLALHHLEPSLSWVVSGINAGGNLGTDVFHSGTVAAAREAVIHGRPGLAVSHYIARGRSIDWGCAARWASRVIADLTARPWEPGTLWNVNLPHPEPGAPEPEVVFCPLDLSPLPLDYRAEDGGRVVRYAGVYQSRTRVPGADVDQCFRGRIVVTLLRLV